jgi:hypothetical protein
MKIAFTSVDHPQSNGSVKRANGLVFGAIKKILKGEKKGKWAEVMPKQHTQGTNKTYMLQALHQASIHAH